MTELFSLLTLVFFRHFAAMFFRSARPLYKIHLHAERACKDKHVFLLVVYFPTAVSIAVPQKNGEGNTRWAQLEVITPLTGVIIPVTH